MAAGIWTLHCFAAGWNQSAHYCCFFLHIFTISFCIPIFTTNFITLCKHKCTYSLMHDLLLSHCSHGGVLVFHRIQPSRNNLRTFPDSIPWCCQPVYGMKQGNFISSLWCFLLSAELCFKALIISWSISCRTNVMLIDRNSAHTFLNLATSLGCAALWSTHISIFHF